MDNLDWRLLLALAREKSMAKAGDALFLSQPAVVYRMNRMEKEFQTQLFYRNTKGIRMSDAGSVLLSHANEMLERSENISQEVKKCGMGLSGSITIASSSTFLTHFLPGQLKSFSGKYPDIFVSFLNQRNDAMLDMITHEKLMVAVIRGNIPDFCNSFHIYDDPLVVINSQPINYEQLQSLQFIPYSRDNGLATAISNWSDRTFSKPLNFNYDTTQSYGIHICLEFVQAGLGWSVVPLSRIRNYVGLYYEPIRALDGSLVTRRTQLVYTDYAKAHRLYSAYIEHFMEYFSKYHFPKV